MKIDRKSIFQLRKMARRNPFGMMAATSELDRRIKQRDLVCKEDMDRIRNMGEKHFRSLHFEGVPK